MTPLPKLLVLSVALSYCHPVCAQYNFNTTNNVVYADRGSPAISGNYFYAVSSGPSSFSVASNAQNNTAFASSGPAISGNYENIDFFSGPEFTIFNNASENSGSADNDILSGNKLRSAIVRDVDGTIVQEATQNEGTAEQGRAVTGNFVEVLDFQNGNLNITNSASENYARGRNALSGNRNFFSYIGRQTSLEIKNTASKNNATSDRTAISGNYNTLSGYFRARPKNTEIKNYADSNYAYSNTNTAISGNKNSVFRYAVNYSLFSSSTNNEANTNFGVSYSGNTNFFSVVKESDLKNIAENNTAKSGQLGVRDLNFAISGNDNRYTAVYDSVLKNVAKNNEANSSFEAVSGNNIQVRDLVQNVEAENIAIGNSASIDDRGYSISGNYIELGTVSNSSITNVASKNYAYNDGDGFAPVVISGNSLYAKDLTDDSTISQIATENIAISKGNGNANSGNKIVLDQIRGKRRL